MCIFTWLVCAVDKLDGECFDGAPNVEEVGLEEGCNKDEWADVKGNVSGGCDEDNERETRGGIAIDLDEDDEKDEDETKGDMYGDHDEEDEKETKGDICGCDSSDVVEREGAVDN